MSRMLRDETDDEPVAEFGARELHIAGESYDNSAAKFWSSLIDEIMLDFPDCDAFALAAPGSGQLSEEVLDPVYALQRELDNPTGPDLQEAIRQAVEEITLFGPAAPISISLFSSTRELKSHHLPTACVDANTFAYLIAWILKWAAIPASGWNNEAQSAKIVALDCERKLDYRMNVAFLNRHLSEGLFKRSVTVQFSRKKHGRKVGP